MAVDIHKFNFDRPEEGVSLDSLKALESRLGGRLDQDFREFLSKVNGGRPDPALRSRMGVLSFPILVFLGLDESKSNLHTNFGDLAQTIGASGLLPIAYDAAYRRICLKVGMRRSPIVLVSLDELYCRESTKITDVCGSFIEFWDSLYQPRKVIPKFEELAERPWTEIKSLVSVDPKHYLGSKVGELTLLCQVIRAENEDAFDGLVAAGAKLDGALEIAVNCERLDFVERLVEAGADAKKGLWYAVGPSRIKIRNYLERHIP